MTLHQLKSQIWIKLSVFFTVPGQPCIVTQLDYRIVRPMYCSLHKKYYFGALSSSGPRWPYDKESGRLDEWRLDIQEDIQIGKRHVLKPKNISILELIYYNTNGWWEQYINMVKLNWWFVGVKVPHLQKEDVNDQPLKMYVASWPSLFLYSLLIRFETAFKGLRLELDLKTALAERKNTYWLCSLDGHKPVVALFPADIAKGPMVPGVLGDVADLMDWVMMQEHLQYKADM